MGKRGGKGQGREGGVRRVLLLGGGSVVVVVGGKLGNGGRWGLRGQASLLVMCAKSAIGLGEVVNVRGNGSGG